MGLRTWLGVKHRVHRPRVARGIMLFDDYLWRQKLPDADRPQLGIDTFLSLKAGEFKEVYRGYQIAIEKL